MTSRGIAVVRAHLAKLPPSESMTLAERRRQYERAERVFPVAPDVKVETATIGGVPGERLTPPVTPPAAVILYLHGGGYCIGSPRSHRHLAAAIGTDAQAVVVLPDYRLAPEHPFPAAVDDAVAVYRALLAEGVAPSRIAIAGDSAGGGLTVATLLALRDARVPLPAAGVCLSPWTDLTCTAASYKTKAAMDPIVKVESIGEMATAYLRGQDPRTPLASPLFADLAGLPPLLIQVGSDEVLLDDAAQLAERANAAGVPTTLEVWPDMVHVWPWFLTLLDEAPAAVAAVAGFVRRSIDPATRP
jgi:phosphinothricin tripeptide acetyl hydrolase